MNYFKTTHYLGKKKRTYNGTFIEIGEANISLWRRGRKRKRERKGEEEEGKEEEEEGDMKKMEKLSVLLKPFVISVQPYKNNEC